MVDLNPPGNRVFDLEYADGIPFLCDNTQGIQCASDRLPIEVSSHGMCFTPSECKVLLQGWQELVLALTLCSDRVEVVNSFNYLENLITPEGSVVEN